jgi:uncharacterized damage-inducible protein DinB
MEMKSHLLDLFQFQDVANRKLFARLGDLPLPEEALRLMSHLVYSQDKWLARLRHEPTANQREWFGPTIALADLPQAWERSLHAWVAYLEGLTEAEVLAEVSYEGPNGRRWAAKLCDIALQLNFHGVHHRAQVQTLCRQQGLQPEFIDYIGGKFRELEG